MSELEERKKDERREGKNRPAVAPGDTLTLVAIAERISYMISKRKAINSEA